MWESIGKNVFLVFFFLLWNWNEYCFDWECAWLVWSGFTVCGIHEVLYSHIIRSDNSGYDFTYSFMVYEMIDERFHWGWLYLSLLSIESMCIVLWLGLIDFTNYDCGNILFWFPFISIFIDTDKRQDVINFCVCGKSLQSIDE